MADVLGIKDTGGGVYKIGCCAACGGITECPTSCATCPTGIRLRFYNSGGSLLYDVTMHNTSGNCAWGNSDASRGGGISCSLVSGVPTWIVTGPTSIFHNYTLNTGTACPLDGTYFDADGGGTYVVVG